MQIGVEFKDVFGVLPPPAAGGELQKIILQKSPNGISEVMQIFFRPSKGTAKVPYRLK